jgi:poly(A) polymerase
MLRAIRFATELDFPIESQTFAAIQKNAARISAISGERIAIELEATLAHPNRGRGAALLFDSGLANAIFSDLPTGHHQRAVDVLRRLRKRVDFALALAALFAECEAEEAVGQCRILKLSRDRTKHLRFLLTHRGCLLDHEMSLASLKKLLAQPYFRDLYELERATRKARGDNVALAALARLQRRVRSLRGVNVKPRRLLNGHDLIRLGATPGPQVGQLAEELYIAQLEGHLHTKNQTKQWVADWLARHAD